MLKREMATIACVAASLLAAGCPQAAGPASRGLAFLQAAQVTPGQEAGLSGSRLTDYAGDWPQFFYFKLAPELRFRDANAFIATFIHHALTLATETNAPALGLTVSEVDAAHTMRKSAMAFLQRFEARAGDPDAGTYGFWPYDPDPNAAETPVQNAVAALFQGPILQGNRAPINVHIFPHSLAIPADADVTATTYAAILDDATIDGGPGTAVAMEQFFAGWRDTGVVPRRLNPSWLPPASGAYLTWLSYKQPPDYSIPNDVDLVVNANVLYALARYGKPATPGFSDAVALINSAVQQGLHRSDFRDLSNYYPPSYVFHYCVSRAFHEGPVPGLAPAVNILADDLEHDALVLPDGTACWNRGAPDLNTAFAVLTLMNAGRSTDLVTKGVAYLLRRQDPVLGSWKEGVFFIARLDGGQEVRWVSPSLTTAFVLEAIWRYRLLP